MTEFLEKFFKSKYIIGCLLVSSFLLSATISIRAENATDASNENKENPYSILVIKEYFEIA